MWRVRRERNQPLEYEGQRRRRGKKGPSQYIVPDVARAHTWTGHGPASGRTHAHAQHVTESRENTAKQGGHGETERHDQARGRLGSRKGPSLWMGKSTAKTGTPPGLGLIGASTYIHRKEVTSSSGRWTAKRPSRTAASQTGISRAHSPARVDCARDLGKQRRVEHGGQDAEAGGERIRCTKANVVVDSRAGVKDPAYLCTEAGEIRPGDAAFPEMFVWHSIWPAVARDFDLTAGWFYGAGKV